MWNDLAFTSAVVLDPYFVNYDYYLTILNSGNNLTRTYDRYEFDREKHMFNKISEEVFREKIKGKISAKNVKILGIKEKNNKSRSIKINIYFFASDPVTQRQNNTHRRKYLQTTYPTKYLYLVYIIKAL